MKEKDIRNILDSYLKGKCTPEEEQKVESWFDRLSSEGDFRENISDSHMQMQSIKNKIDNQIRNDRFFKLSPILKVAASVILIASVCLFGYYKNAWLINQIDPVHYALTSAPKGQKIRITLSDGSTVILNSGSQIRYPKEFNRAIRKVTLLEGEAFFDIRHDEEKPFVVETPGTQTQVLGTAFNVQAYKELKDVKITVIRGKVAVKETRSGKQKHVFLLPNEQVIVNSTTGDQAKKHINANESIGWIQGKFQFKNESLLNVALILQNTYNVKIQFKEEAIKAIRFTANFNSTDSLERILFAIAKANKLTYSIKNNIILFKYKNQLSTKSKLL